MNKQSHSKKLYRSRNQRLIGGVCGGLAEYFDVDPTWIRLIFIICLLFFGSTLIIYLILWVIVPEEPPSYQDQTHRSESHHRDDDRQG